MANVLHTPKLQIYACRNVAVSDTRMAIGWGTTEEGETIMSNSSGRSVYRRGVGKWVNKRNDAERAGSIHSKQKEAWDTAKNMLHHEGGGELTVMGRHGRIVSKDTIPPGPDPNPPKDREH